MKTHQISAGGIVVKRTSDGTKVLLINDRFGYWTWPKGHLEKGETPRDAAMREIEEETGVANLGIVEEVGIQEYSFTSGIKEILKTVHVFLVESLGDSVIKVQTEEISGAEWFSPEEAGEKIGYEGSKDILKKALNEFACSK